MILVGGTLLWQAFRHGRGHVHGFGHGHGHSHGHEHVHEHGHGVAPAARTGSRDRGSVVLMGVAGGMVPSPSAVVVLLGAAALGHAWFGVVLVIGYGAGMALILALAGLVVVRLSERIQDWLIHSGRSQLLRTLPVVTAGAVVVLGAALTVRGVASALAAG